MDEHPVDLHFEIALALRDVRIYAQRGREALSLADKQGLARTILDGLARARITLTAARDALPAHGRGTGEYMPEEARIVILTRAALSPTPDPEETA